MKYYESHEDCYRKMKKNNVSSWDEFKEESNSFENFFMKDYLVIALDRIKPISNAKDQGLDIHFSVDDICSFSKTRSEFYDIVIDTHCMHCITYDSDRYAALTNTFRLLKNGGYFIMETMSIEDPSKWPHDGRIDEQGIV